MLKPVFTPCIIACLFFQIGIVPSTSAQVTERPETWTWNVPEETGIPGVRHGELFSPSMKRMVGFNIYLPPSYVMDGARRFPVIYYLHGATGTEKSDAGLARLVDKEIKAGRIREVIYVFPNGGAFSHYRDWANENVKAETWLIHELIPHVDSTYRTINTGSGRAIAGFSMGGDGAIRLAMKYPDLFLAVATQAAALDWGAPEGSDDTVYRWSMEQANRLKKGLNIKMVVGADDELYQLHIPFLKHLDSLGIAYDFKSFPGVGHDLGKLNELDGQNMIRMLDTGLKEK